MNTTDPFLALQRDSDTLKDNSFDEGAIKSMYDNQLAQLENLIATQRKAQMKMREQLSTAEKKYHKVDKKNVSPNIFTSKVLKVE